MKFFTLLALALVGFLVAGPIGSILLVILWLVVRPRSTQ